MFTQNIIRQLSRAILTPPPSRALPTTSIRTKTTFDFSVQRYAPHFSSKSPSFIPPFDVDPQEHASVALSEKLVEESGKNLLMTAIEKSKSASIFDKQGVNEVRSLFF